MTRAVAQAQRQALTQYENMLLKFVEFLEVGEYERAQGANNQAQKTWKTRQPYFVFNFGL